MTVRVGGGRKKDSGRMATISQKRQAMTRRLPIGAEVQRDGGVHFPRLGAATSHGGSELRPPPAQRAVVEAARVDR